ncbi:MAG: hypothetical protein Q7O66_13090, partial [Dehalococcoidia bacterium]|nr:hypothetical protein [Dehalococcoidia bacterium]
MAGRRIVGKPSGGSGSQPHRGLWRTLILAVIPLIVAAVFVTFFDSPPRLDVLSGVPAQPPKPIWGYVIDEYSSSPIMSATVKSGNLTVESDADGEYNIGVLPKGTSVSFAAPGYEPVTTSVDGGINLSVALRPRTFAGKLIDVATLKAVAGATVFYNGAMLTPTLTGTFHLEDVPASF